MFPTKTDWMNETEGLSPEMFQIVGVDESKDRVLRPHISYWQDAWRRFKKNKLAVFGLFLMIVLTILVVFGPIIAKHSFEETNIAESYHPIDKDYWFGADKLGRDYFARVWQGGRVSIIIGVTGAFICAFVGCIYGGIASYFGGKIDSFMMRIVEILSSIPYLLVVILLSLWLDAKGIKTLLLAMCLTGWTGIARLVRSQMITLRQSDYVLAAKLLGVKPLKIVTSHLIPNTIGLIIVNITFRVPSLIFSEAFLSFLGLGIQSPETSWGALCSAAQTVFTFKPHLMFFPAICIALTMLAFTLMGDGLRDALDPRQRK